LDVKVGLVERVLNHERTELNREVYLDARIRLVVQTAIDRNGDVTGADSIKHEFSEECL
jgi:hypothetical protein